MIVAAAAAMTFAAQAGFSVKPCEGCGASGKSDCDVAVFKVTGSGKAVVPTSGDYKTVMGDGMLHSATNYECYKGLFSSFNSMNMFEVNHSLMRQFGADPWCLYRGYHLLSFVETTT